VGDLELRVTVLMHEYDTLRAEILQRMSHRFAIMGFAGVVGGYMLFEVKRASDYQTLFLAVAAAFLLAIWWQMGRVMLRCSNRIAEIELAVEQLLPGVGMCWESGRRGSPFMHKVHGD